MKRIKMLLVLAVAGGLFAGRLAADDKKEDVKLPVCPVMGETINFSVSTETEDGPVYFCCPGCIGKFKKDPDKYVKGLAEQRAVLAKLDKVQVACPVTGEELDPTKQIEHDGEKLTFCCGGCIRKFKQDPAKYKAGLAASYTYQTKCPVSGERIDPASSTVLPTGETIYFCCDGCAKKLLADPAKYADNLAKQGTPINPAKIKQAEEAGKGG
jgi:YHS domain-containing protein